jgi:xanthine dehydrogenase accessory factor
MGETASAGPYTADPGLADEVLARAAELRARGTTFAVATVVRTQSPTSSRPGDKALITSDGRLWGWIGGSCSEGLVRQEALRAIGDGQPRLVQISPDQAPDHVPGVVSHVNTCPSGGSLDVFIDPQIPPPLLVVVGSTPVARTLVRLGDAVGFRTCAVHPGATPTDFPDADVTLSTLDFADAGFSADTWAIVATMGHYDEEALPGLLTLDLPYIGLIASRRRASAVRTMLTARGVAGLDRIRRPGDDAVRWSQQEIALAALNEVVTERRQRQALTSLPAMPPGTAVDPICGMTVDPADAVHQLRQGDATVYFCSAHCREAFMTAGHPAMPSA